MYIHNGPTHLVLLDIQGISLIFKALNLVSNISHHGISIRIHHHHIKQISMINHLDLTRWLGPIWSFYVILCLICWEKLSNSRSLCILHSLTYKRSLGKQIKLNGDAYGQYIFESILATRLMGCQTDGHRCWL